MLLATLLRPGNVPRSIAALWLLGQNAACRARVELLVADDLTGLTYIVRRSPSELDHHVSHLRWRLGRGRDEGPPRCVSIRGKAAGYCRSGY